MSLLSLYIYSVNDWIHIVDASCSRICYSRQVFQYSQMQTTTHNCILLIIAVSSIQDIMQRYKTIFQWKKQLSECSVILEYDWFCIVNINITAIFLMSMALYTQIQRGIKSKSQLHSSKQYYHALSQSDVLFQSKAILT